MVYIYLFSEIHTVFNTIPNVDENVWTEITKKIKNNILFAVFGIKEPGEEVTVNLINMLQKKLDMKVMQELQGALLKNPQLKMNEADISVGFEINRCREMNA